MSHQITCQDCGFKFIRDHSPEFTLCYWCEWDDGTDDYGVNDVPGDAEEDRHLKWLEDTPAGGVPW